MPRKQFEVPPAAARSFFQDMRAFFAEKNSIKADEIAACQIHVLRQPGKAWTADQATRRESDIKKKGPDCLAKKGRPRSSRCGSGETIDWRKCDERLESSNAQHCNDRSSSPPFVRRHDCAMTMLLS
jgi:hypothetical protein